MFSGIPNLQIHNFFSQKMSWFFNGAAKGLFLKINSFSHIFDLNRKILPCLKRKQKNRGFVDSGFLKTCHEHYISVS